MKISPYWKEEDGVSILADGFLGFVVSMDGIRELPQNRNVAAYQIVWNEFIGKPLLAVRTNFKLAYKGSYLKTFFSPSYAREQMKIIYNAGYRHLMTMKDSLSASAVLQSAMALQNIFSTKPHFIYFSGHIGSYKDLIGRVDFSYARCGNRESFIINSDNIVADMGICYELGFFPVSIPRNIFYQQMKFLSAPLGAIPRFLQTMNLFSRRIADV